MSVRKETQYIVTAPYEPDGLARLTGALADAGVGLGGVVVTRAGECLQLKFLAKPRKALKARLESKGARVHEAPVLLLDGDPMLDLLDRAASALAARGISVLSCYRHVEGARSSWVLSVDKLEEAAAALEPAAAARRTPTTTA